MKTDIFLLWHIIIIKKQYCPKLLPKAIAERCHRKRLPKAMAESCHRKLLPKAMAESNIRKQ